MYVACELCVYRNQTMTALITPVSDVAVALRVNHEKTEAAVMQVSVSTAVDSDVSVTSVSYQCSVCS